MSDRLELLKKMLLEDPNDSFLLFAMAKEYEAGSNIDLAIQHYEQVRTNDPNYVGLYYHLGAAYQEKELKDKALETYRKGIEIAKSLKDHHALSELKGVLLNLELDLD